MPQAFKGGGMAICGPRNVRIEEVGNKPEKYRYEATRVEVKAFYSSPQSWQFDVTD